VSDNEQVNLASDDEIQAALREAEAEELPSLDDGGDTPQPGGVVAVPVNFDEPPGTTTRVVEPPTPPRRPESAPQEPPAADADFVEDDADVPATNRLALLGRRLYRALDRGLELVNQPFKSVGPELRSLVGVLAIVTLVMSILAATLLPALLPNRTTVSELQRQAAAVATPGAADTAPPK
jgi:hypothetical protein